MMLFIDTTDQQQARLLLISRSKPSQMVWADKKLSQSIFVNLKRLLKRSGIRNLKKIAVVVGPGPFSRVRTGVVAANALGFALKVSIVGVRKDRLPENLSRLFARKGGKQVLPFYASPANITKNKKIS